ncbi:MAG: hypothetical protein LR011_01715 [Verrucomicrobia bacterium]|nr:hypothetical protein [Verrucomicrobiota bacterium]
MKETQEKFHIIKPVRLVGLIAAVIVFLYVIVPSNKRTLNNALEDGNLNVADDVLHKISESEKQSDPFYSDKEFQLLLAKTYSSVNANITEAVPTIIEQYRKSNKTEKETIHTIKLIRAAGLPEKAVPILSEYESHSGKSNADHSSEFLEIKVVVLQENNLTSSAFDAYHQYFNQLDTFSKNELFKLIDLARAGNRLLDVAELSTNKILLQNLNKEDINDAEIYEKLGNVALAVGNNDAAINHFLYSIQCDNTKNYLHAEIGKAYEWSNRPETAFEHYIKSLGNNDNYAIERLLDLAQGLYKTKDLGQVLEKFPDKILKLDKGLFLARVYIETGERQNAYAWYEKLCDSESADVSIFLEYITIRLAGQEYEEAVRIATRGLEKFPEEIHFHELIAEILLNSLQYEKAFQKYYALVSRDLNHNALGKTIDLGIALGKENDITDLLKMHRAAGTLKSPFLYELLAMSEFRHGNYKAFQSIIEEGINQNPSNHVLKEKLIISFQKLGNTEAAVKMIEDNQNELLNNQYILNFYVDYLLNNNNILKADKIITEFPREESKNNLQEKSFKDLFRARIATIKKDYPEALRIYNELESQNMLLDYHLISFLEIAVIVNDWSLANKLIDKMSGIDHEDYYVHASRACLYQGNDTRALNYLSRVTTPNKLAHLWRDFGDYYENAGNKNQSKLAYSKSLKYLGLEIY